MGGLDERYWDMTMGLSQRGASFGNKSMHISVDYYT